MTRFDDDPWWNSKLPGTGNHHTSTGHTYTGHNSNFAASTPCHHSHPPYPVAGNWTVFGGSGEVPKVAGCDIYVSLSSYRTPNLCLPWRKQEAEYDLIFPIQDGGTPRDPNDFRAMIEWLAEQIGADKKVHIGCMAGHGRTGLVLAALRSFMAADVNAIQHVRDNYCARAVESFGQVDFLVKHYACAMVAPSKPHAYSTKSATKLPRYIEGLEGPETKRKRGKGTGTAKGKSKAKTQTKVEQLFPKPEF